MTVHWITATPPTPNGELHLGHLAGPYVAGDVLRRFLRADGVTTRYTSGLDDHQSYVAVRGRRAGMTAEEVAERNGERIVDTWHRIGAALDRIGRPRADTGYHEYVTAFFARLVADGHIVERTRPLPYCPPCDRWLYEAYVTGGCPHCGVTSNGNACEPCGRPNDCGDLTNPFCSVCGETARPRENRRLYFPLAPFADRLREFWSTVDMPPHLRALCEAMDRDGLPEIAVSHPSDWGVPVPTPGFESHRIYVWFEMAPGYLLEFDPTGRDRPDTGAVQFFGIDNGYFHAVLFPALWSAYDPTIPLPRAFLVNEFYQLEGKKFSTSRGHAVWAGEALAADGPDTLRHHLLSDRPTGRETSFTPPALAATKRRLIVDWNGWLDALFGALRDTCGGVVPEEKPGDDAWHRLRARLENTVAELRVAYDVAGFDPRRAVALLDEMVRMAADHHHETAHHRSRPDGARAHRAALVAGLTVAGALAAWAAPVLPHGSARLAAALGLPADRPVDLTSLVAPPASTVLTPPEGRVFGD